MDNNFECKSCNFCFFIPKYTVNIVKERPTTYTIGTEEICCPECNSVEIKPILRGVCTNIGEYSSASAEDKKTMLKRRAKKAMEKDAEQRHEIGKNFHGKINEKHY